MNTSIKQEEKQDIKVIQLVGDKKPFLWKSKDKGMIQMSEMSNEHLQAALVVVQNRQMRSLDVLQMDYRLEEELKQTAKEKGITLLEYDEAVKNAFSKKYKKNVPLIKQLGVYLKRKINEFSKQRTES